MNSLFNKYRWLQLILSILLLFGGVIVIIFAFINEGESLNIVLNIVAAVILFLFGGFTLIAAFAFERQKYFTTSLLYGSAAIALGVILCLQEYRDLISDLLVLLLAIFFIVVGAIELIRGVILVCNKTEKSTSLIVITFVIAAIFITGGILSIIFGDKIKIAYYVIAGSLLALAGVFEIIFGIKALLGNPEKKKTSKKKKQKDVVVINEENTTLEIENK